MPEQANSHVGSAALACSVSAAAFKVSQYFEVRHHAGAVSPWLGGLSFALTLVALVLGLLSRTTPAGRLALLAPLAALLGIAYYLLKWYGL